MTTFIRVDSAGDLFDGRGRELQLPPPEVDETVGKAR
jgi:hypothetical protein